MNYKQIKDLYRQDEWGKCTSNKIGAWFEFLEAYTYDTEIGVFITIPKGTWMKFYCLSLGNTYHFEFHEREKLHLTKIGFGKSRLLKLKLREIDPLNSKGDE